MFAYCNNNPIILDDSEGNIPNYCTMLTDSGSKVIGGKTGENHRYIIAPENYSVTIKNDPPDNRRRVTITMTYYTPQQVKDQVYQDMYAQYGDYHSADIISDAAISIGLFYGTSKFASYFASLPQLGLWLTASEAVLMSLYHYGRSEHERFLKDLTERGLGMVEVHYSAYGVQGGCYVPWDGSSNWDTGAYPYARR